ncbi:single-stranded-DNA-specific exonuclease RecJ [Natranaerobius trueperi]|uniref:Single-stranded-DNA-specific exonuclease RecJ n=1 Tax=Natranaerobius trueperi TaxID=759412 RepID=A0A226BX69_9FIRM|nr:single-stranded-DNA-specific exonuclease RecJ [Natranaerobius trueperi]OWZ83613.1 single-stranded-DNA-specific exonuclease RecJ [Natranaerobius trueperi]
MVANKLTSWNMRVEYTDLIQDLALECSVSPVLAQLLVNRGLTKKEEINSFLSPSLDELESPWLLDDIQIGVDLIQQALDDKKSILIFGDYDADGVTSTALLYDYLTKFNDRINYFIPDRFADGYGLSESGITKALKLYPDTSLIITVDCGISSCKEVSWLKEKGINVVITDHHEQLNELPSADAILNPKRVNSCYPFSSLAGVGVAFKLVLALADSSKAMTIKQLCENYLDLVAVGTIADLVPLKHENRILVSHGLSKIGSNRVGFKSMLEKLNLLEQKLTTGQVGFLLGPRINAAGRLASASDAVRLLVTDDYDEAQTLAEKLDTENRERRTVEQEITKEANEIIVDNNKTSKSKVLVLYGKDWHEGVIGIVASRLLEKYHRPVIVLTLDNNGVAKGSCRSIEGFHIAEALQECSDIIEKYGGHELAAGLSIKVENIEEFEQRINQLADKWLTENDLIPTVDIEMMVPEEILSRELAEEIQQLEPFGIGNPQPILGCNSIIVASTKIVGKNNEHLQVKFKGSGSLLDGIWFRGNEKLTHNLEENTPSKAAFIPKISTWNSKWGKLSLQICDLQCDETSNKLIDFRNKSDKYSSLNLLIKRNYIPVILTNTRQQKEFLSSKFVDCYVVRATDVPFELSEENVLLILYDLPYDPSIVRKWIETIKPKSVCLLYNHFDVDYNSKLWRVTIPYGQELQKVYEKMQNEFKFQTVTKGNFKKWLYEQNSGVTKRWVESVIEIFKELGLIYLEDNKVKIKETENRVDFSNSNKFLSEQQLIKNIRKWEQCFLSGSNSAIYMLLYENKALLEVCAHSIEKN